jgi:hypothetical protein
LDQKFLDNRPFVGLRSISRYSGVGHAFGSRIFPPRQQSENCELVLVEHVSCSWS